MNSSGTSTNGDEHGVLARYTQAWLRGDVATLIDCYADDIVAHYGGQSSYAGTHRGRDRFLEVLAETAVVSNRELLSVDQIHENGEWGAAFVTERLMVGGETVTLQRSLRFRLEENRIRECWLFDMDQHLVDSAWATSVI